MEELREKVREYEEKKRRELHVEVIEVEPERVVIRKRSIEG